MSRTATNQSEIVSRTSGSGKSQTKPADKLFLFAVLSLMFMSLVVVYSASAFWSELKFQNPAYLLRSHLFKVATGVILIFFVAKFDYHKYQKYALHLLVISGSLLIIAMGQRVVIKGASRWIHLGIFSFEPSEIARIAILFFVAAYLAESFDKLDDYRSLFRPIAATGIITGLIVLQPNFSTALMIFAVVGVLLVAGGVRKRHLAALVLTAVVLGVGVMMLQSYRVARVESWLHHGSGNYQVHQSIIGFGNGGILGVGPGNSKQRNLFLPESYGDFIYSIIGEEYGLWGSVLVMLIFLFIAFRGTAIAKRAPDRFGFLLATGITSAICLYAFINAGVAIGLFPTTGLPMPFISYGGTAMIVNSMAAGVLLNVSKQIPAAAESEVAGQKLKEVRRPVAKNSDPVVGRIYS
ncbi:MAG: putative lipid II flippase FtsW [Bacteroidetes bacterium]|nr:putative lipid II flippase FtsW [Bacteroidota bacterium]